jgi:hypothetical protein
MAVERVLTFGKGNGLVGILCEPPAERRIPGAPAILTWNVGINHRIGPFRIYVDLARKLADAGFTTLRFDIAGLGDSDFDRDDSRSDAERAIADVQSAMRTLTEQRKFERFVPVGFCSSVDAAHRVGATDERVAGVIYLEGYGFRTRGYYLHYPLRLLDKNRWERRLRIWMPKLFGETSQTAGRLAAEREEIYIRDYPEPTAFAADVNRMVDRGVKLLFVYAGGDTTYIYRNQLFELLGRRYAPEQIELDFNANADHTFFLIADRERGMNRVVDWMTRSFGAAAKDPRAERRAGAPSASANGGLR